MSKITVIGAGLSGLYAACYLAKQGHEVTVLEKNESVGGRSRIFKENGYTFDMGPSWYWMPELIDSLFEDLGENREAFFKLQRLDPSYKIFWNDTVPSDVPANKHALLRLFDTFEEHGGEKLDSFLNDAKKKYEIAVPEFLEKPGLKLSEVMNAGILRKALKMDVFKSVDKDVSRRFKSPKAKGILNFPVLFLGEMPERIPSLYTLMNHADMGLGTWYPEGGMSALANALKKIAERNGVKFLFNHAVDELVCNANEISGVKVGNKVFETDGVIGAADYHFIEQNLIPKNFRRYTESYWDKRRLAPSCMIYYLGVNKQIEGLEHHNLFFDEDIEAHGKEIYEHPKWPEKPLFYACVPSKTDKDVAPENCENIFLLIPVAPNLEDTQETRDHYFDLIMNRMEKHTGTDIRANVTVRRDFSINDFKSDYNSYKGNAYGLANTLMQTANLKPKIKSKLKNLYYCGQLTVPGPGVPPSLISGKIAAKQLTENL